MTEQEELAIEVLTEQLERARFETIDLGNIREKKDEIEAKEDGYIK